MQKNTVLVQFMKMIREIQPDGTLDRKHNRSISHLGLDCESLASLDWIFVL